MLLGRHPEVESDASLCEHDHVEQVGIIEEDITSKLGDSRHHQFRPVRCQFLRVETAVYPYSASSTPELTRILGGQCRGLGVD